MNCIIDMITPQACRDSLQLKGARGSRELGKNRRRGRAVLGHGHIELPEAAPARRCYENIVALYPAQRPRVASRLKCSESSQFSSATGQTKNTR